MRKSLYKTIKVSPIPPHQTSLCPLYALIENQSIGQSHANQGNSDWILKHKTHTTSLPLEKVVVIYITSGVIFFSVKTYNLINLLAFL